MKSHLASNLKILRRKKQLSQNELAEELGITRNKIASYEGNHAEPKLDILCKFSEHFQVDIMSLIKIDLSNDAHYYTTILLQGSKADNKKTLSNGSSSSNQRNIGMILAEFEEKNRQIDKMAQSFRTFYDRSLKREDPDPIDKLIVSEENLLYILESLVETNKSIAKRLRMEL